MFVPRLVTSTPASLHAPELIAHCAIMLSVDFQLGRNSVDTLNMTIKTNRPLLVMDMASSASCASVNPPRSGTPCGRSQLLSHKTCALLLLAHTLCPNRRRCSHRPRNTVNRQSFDSSLFCNEKRPIHPGFCQQGGAFIQDDAQNLHSFSRIFCDC